MFPQAKKGTHATYMKGLHPEAYENKHSQIIADLAPKQNYGTELRMLQFALEQGYMVTKTQNYDPPIYAGRLDRRAVWISTLITASDLCKIL